LAIEAPAGTASAMELPAHVESMLTPAAAVARQAEFGHTWPPAAHV
jgi:hypothetical protein